MAVSKVELTNGDVLIDLTEDTVTPETLAEGVTAHDKSGAAITGTIPIVRGGVSQEVVPEDVGYMPYIRMSHTITERKLIDPEYGGDINLQAPYEAFGDASAQDVAAGKTFTSADGLLVVGTAAKPVIEPLEITENGTYEAPDGVDGFSPITVIVPASGGVDEGTNSDAFTAFIMGDALEVYNDKVSGTLPAYAFYEKDGITKIELPNIQYLKERCFYTCGDLETLLLPGLIGYTYQYMAAYCSKLVTVDIHNCSYVSSYTFRNCTSLKQLDLHKAETIATYAFNGCTKLETLILRMDAIPTLGGTNAFTNTKIAGGTGYIYVPRAWLSDDDETKDYRRATNWSNYQYRALEDYTVDGTIMGELDPNKI